jgi:transcriptional regulator with XRE-family HTH domain
VALPSKQKIALQLGRELAQARTASGQTQEQVADLLDVNMETVSRIERGVMLPSIPRLLELAAIYNIPASTLLGRSSVHAPDIAEKVSNQLSRLNEDDRVWVGQWMDELCDRLAAASKTRPRLGKRQR